MNILHIIDDLAMGGAENLLVGLAGEQVRIGHNVTVTPLVESNNSVVKERLLDSNVLVTPAKTSGSLYNPLLLFKLIPIIKRYDIVHVHLFPALYWAGLAKLCSLSKVPLVYTEHSTSNRRRNKYILHITDGFIYQNCYKKVIACSVKAQDSFHEAFPSVQHYCTINNGADIHRYSKALPYSKKELLGVAEDTFIVTMVARFMSMKRQDTIIESIAKIPDVHVVFVGGEENDAGLVRIKRMTQELKVSERVHFLYVRKDVPRILKTTDVVIMASDYEGLSLSSIEGMAAGKPMVASDVDGLREVVGGAGVLFENRNSEQLSEILVKLKRDKIYYEAVSERCTQRAKEYDINTMADSYLKVYVDVMAK